jgi:hypothetical protein
VSLVEEPVPRAAQVLLRRLVLDHLATEHRRVFPSVLHLGRPGRPDLLEMAALTEPPVAGRRSAYDALDDAQRCDVLEAVLRRSPDDDDLAWLTRPGALDLQDADAAWARAVSAVTGETGCPLRFVVVTRKGWRDPRSGVGREWRRLRQR